MKQIEQLIQQLDSISRLTSEIGGGTAQDWAMKVGHRYDSWMTENTDKALPAITRNIDRSIWRDLMLKSGMMALMDAQARDQWHKNLERGICLPSVRRISSVLLSNYIGTKWMYLSVALSMSSKACHGITKPIVLVASVRKSSSTIW
jgi:hypothetical protein